VGSCFRSFPGDPHANVWWAVFEGRATEFAGREEHHHIAIDERDLSQVERDRTLSISAVDHPSEFSEVLRFDLTAQHDPYTLAVLGPLDLQHGDIRAAETRAIVSCRLVRPPA